MRFSDQPCLRFAFFALSYREQSRIVIMNGTNGQIIAGHRGSLKYAAAFGGLYKSEVILKQNS